MAGAETARPEISLVDNWRVRCCRGIGLGALIWEGARTLHDQERVISGINKIDKNVESIQRAITSPPKASPQPTSPMVASVPPRVIQVPAAIPQAKPEKPRLKPLISYTDTNLIFNGKPEGTVLQGFYLVIMNEADEPIEAKITQEIITLDGKVVLGKGCDADVGIIEAKKGATATCTRTGGDFLIPPDSKKAEVLFTVEYDTVSHTGLRRSLRDITYDLSWPNGPDKPAQAMQVSNSGKEIAN